MARVVYDFYMTQAASALEIAYDSRKRKSYRLNRPLVFFFFFFFTNFHLIPNFHPNTMHSDFWPSSW